MLRKKSVEKGKPKAGWQCPVCKREFARKSQMHSCKVTSLEVHLAKSSPETVLIYEAIEGYLRSLGPLSIAPTKTGINLLSRTSLGSIAFRKDSLDVGFVLTYELRSPRISWMLQLSPRTFAYRTRLQSMDDFDDECREWLRQAHEVGMMAGRRGKSGG
jgi:hypothetical protein